MTRFVTLLLVVAATTTAHATPRKPESPQPIREQKSEATATALAIAGTAAGAAMVIAGDNTKNDTLFLVGGAVLVLAPSAGHWYAGEPLTWGLGVRILGAGVAFTGLVQRIACISDCGGGDLIVGGLIALGVGALIDIGTAGHEARTYNERHWTVTPTLVAAGQSHAMGLGVGGAF